jgi:hypothetical protein
MTFIPWLRIADLPIARIAALRPGESPPAVRMPIPLATPPSLRAGDVHNTVVAEIPNVWQNPEYQRREVVHID